LNDGPDKRPFFGRLSKFFAIFLPIVKDHLERNISLFIGSIFAIACIGLLLTDVLFFLQNGLWKPTTISDFTEMTVNTSWVGVNDILNWVIHVNSSQADCTAKRIILDCKRNHLECIRIDDLFSDKVGNMGSVKITSKLQKCSSYVVLSGNNVCFDIRYQIST